MLLQQVAQRGQEFVLVGSGYLMSQLRDSLSLLTENSCIKNRIDTK